MASSPLRSKSKYHARSVSLPSRLHPLSPHIDENLRLNGLSNMFDHLLLLLPHTQQAFAQQQHEPWVKEVLEKYLRLLDICAVAKEVSTQTKLDVQNILSILRRRRDTNVFSGYLTSRKKAKKEIQKSLKDLKRIKSKTSTTAFDKSHGVPEILRWLNDVEDTAIGVLEYLLSYMAGKKMESRLSGFSLVSKLMPWMAVASKEEETNVFEKFDAALQSLNSNKTSKIDAGIYTEIVQNQLEEMELSIQDMEEGLECLLRRLIKTRVSLLNIFNH
ncbi:hypothetical protein Vadar_015616 [Vaccinium darrowii]|uniref:Uncharacterized protein n=1 Tax=Vaccinium darrowii TaxID=229202 RepID=A0ACB7YDW1_9ERIC|nr:hypothetical protein Vadar_015616 [Vaccinium darrowii]